MKKRFLSMLLSAVMLLTLLPATAGAAVREADQPTIHGVYFYADNAKAEEKFEEIISNNRITESDSSNDPAAKDSERDTMIVHYSGLEPSTRYALMVHYPKTALQYDPDCSSELMTDNKETWRKIEWDTPARGKFETKDYLRSFSLRVSDKASKFFDKDGSGIYTVKLCKVNTNNNDPEVKYESLPGCTMEIKLADVTIDFGTENDPADCIQTEAPAFYETTAIDSDAVESNSKTAARFFADTDNLERFDTMTDQEQFEKYLGKLLTIEYPESANYAGDSWTYKTLDSTGLSAEAPSVIFSRRTQLKVGDINAPELTCNDSRPYTDYEVKLADGQTDEFLSAASDNTIKISATNLASYVPATEGLNKPVVEGYWAAFSISVPEGAAKVRYCTADTSSALKKAEFTLDGFQNVSGSATLYLPAPEKDQFFAVQFYGSDFVPVTQRYAFRVNTTGVSKNTAAKLPAVQSGSKDSVTVTEDIITPLIAASNKNGNTVAIEVVNSSRDTVVVTFTAEALVSAQGANVDLEIITRIGTIKLPADDLPTIANDRDEDVSLIISQPANFINGYMFADQRAGSAEFQSVDVFHVEVVKGDAPQTLTGKTITLTRKLLNALPNGGTDPTVDTLTFTETNRPSYYLPTILERGAAYDEQKNAVTLTVDTLPATHGAALRTIVDRMYAAAADDEITLEESDGTPIPLFEDVELKTETVLDASKMSSYADTKQTAVDVYAKTSDPEVTINVPEASKELIEGKETEIKEATVTVDLKDKTAHTVKIKSGPMTYSIHFTKVLSTDDHKLLKISRAQDQVMQGLDKITVLDAIDGRFYYAQFDKTQSINGASVTTRYYYILKKMPNQEVSFYVPLYNAGASTKLKASIWEISEGVDEPFIEDYTSDDKGLPFHFNPEYDRTVQDVVIERTK